MESLPALRLHFPVCKMEVVKELIEGDCGTRKTGLSSSPWRAGDGVPMIYWKKKISETHTGD